MDPDQLLQYNRDMLEYYKTVPVKKKGYIFKDHFDSLSEKIDTLTAYTRAIEKLERECNRL